MGQRMIDQRAAMERKRPRPWLMNWLHRYKWETSAVAKRLGISVELVHREMRRLKIPTMQDLLSVEYQGEVATVTGHARRFGVHPSTAHRRYQRGLPLDDVFRPVTEDEIEALEMLASAGMTAEQISATTDHPPEVVAAVTSAPRDPAVIQETVDEWVRRMLRDNPAHTLETLKPYLQH